MTIARPAKHRRKHRAPGYVCLLALIPAGLTGCGVDLTVGIGGSGGADQLPPEQRVEIKLVNRTDAAIETALFVSTNALENPATDLFIPENLFTNRVGVAATGLIPPFGTDMVDIECGEQLTIGTAQSRFLDQETGDPLGVGSSRVIELGPVFDCGDRISFIYDRQGGEYLVDLTIE